MPKINIEFDLRNDSKEFLEKVAGMIAVELDLRSLRPMDESSSIPEGVPSKPKGKRKVVAATCSAKEVVAMAMRLLREGSVTYEGLNQIAIASGVNHMSELQGNEEATAKFREKLEEVSTDGKSVIGAQWAKQND